MGADDETKSVTTLEDLSEMKIIKDRENMKTPVKHHFVFKVETDNYSTSPHDKLDRFLFSSE